MGIDANNLHIAGNFSRGKGIKGLRAKEENQTRTEKRGNGKGGKEIKRKENRGGKESKRKRKERGNTEAKEKQKKTR